MFQAELTAGACEAMSFVAGAVVGEEAASLDAELTEPGHSGGQEMGGAALGLVRVHGGEGEPRVVVDSDVQELCADAFDRVAAVARHAVRRPLDAHQALDVQMQEVASSGNSNNNGNSNSGAITTTATATAGPSTSALAKCASAFAQDDTLGVGGEQRQQQRQRQQQ
jgi:hypothetical protein